MRMSSTEVYKVQTLMNSKKKIKLRNIHINQSKNETIENPKIFYNNLEQKHHLQEPYHDCL